MLAVILTSSIVRIVPIGMALLALQKTLFVELTPFGVIVQIVLAFAAAAGAAGGPDRGAVAGFTLGIMFDLAIGTPLGSSAITMGIAGYLAGGVNRLRFETTWWMAAIFVGFGAAAGELLVPVVRRFIGEEDAFAPDLVLIVPVVAIAAAVTSPALVPVGRWALRIQKAEWKMPVDA